MTEKVSDVDKIVIEAVDKAFEVLGSAAKQALYYHLENSYGISKEDIAKNPEKFIEALYSIFGVGAEMLEHIIVKEINAKVKQQQSGNFVEIVKNLSH